VPKVRLGCRGWGFRPSKGRCSCARPARVFPGFGLLNSAVRRGWRPARQHRRLGAGSQGAAAIRADPRADRGGARFFAAPGRPLRIEAGNSVHFESHRAGRNVAGAAGQRLSRPHHSPVRTATSAGGGDAAFRAASPARLGAPAGWRRWGGWGGRGRRHGDRAVGIRCRAASIMFAGVCCRPPPGRVFAPPRPAARPIRPCAQRGSRCRFRAHRPGAECSWRSTRPARR